MGHSPESEAPIQTAETCTFESSSARNACTMFHQKPEHRVKALSTLPNKRLDAAQLQLCNVSTIRSSSLTQEGAPWAWKTPQIPLPENFAANPCSSRRCYGVARWDGAIEIENGPSKLGWLKSSQLSGTTGHKERVWRELDQGVFREGFTPALRTDPGPKVAMGNHSGTPSHPCKPSSGKLTCKATQRKAKAAGQHLRTQRVLGVSLFVFHG